MPKLSWLVAVCAALPMAAACGGGGNDNVDSGSGGHIPQCRDGIDNDGDGLIDFPADPGCTGSDDDSEDSVPAPQCSDGIDNDGDGKIDYPNDPGCFSPNADSEVDSCPSGSDCPQCGNGIDDDGNGLIDYPADPGCMSASDPTEFTANSSICSGATVIQLTSGSADGTLDSTSTTTLTNPCHQGGTIPAIAYQITLTDPKVVIATTSVRTTGSDENDNLDTVIDIRGSACSDGSAEIACNDNTDNSSTIFTSTATASLQAGTYYIIVEGFDNTAVGDFHLDVQELAGEGAPCGSDADCGTGLVCNPTGSGSACTEPECNDGIDNNGDGLIDFPNDPSCTSPSDNTEVTVCPGALCPQCSDGIDNDGDGQIDYPADTSCSSAAGTSESCQSVDPILSLTGPDTSGTLTGSHDDFTASCADDTGLDQIYGIVVPQLTSLSITANSSVDDELLIDLLGASCGTSGDLGCEFAFDGPLSLTNVAAGQYFILVDDDFPELDEQGAYDLLVSGTVAYNQPCEGDLFDNGVLTCEDGGVCSGSAGHKVCAAPQCSDGSDNNGDGKTDYPDDPGCRSPSDNSETTVCPGSNCPACSDGIDNDGDGLIDYPADPSCQAAGGTSESCNTVDPVLTLSGPSTSGTLVGAADDYQLICDEDDGGLDQVYAFQVPNLASLTISADVPTFDFEPTVALLDSTCALAELACKDDDTISITNLPAGQYFIVIDEYFGSFDEPAPYTLDVSGTIAAGGACNVPLFTDGVLTCTVGTSCSPATHKCQ